MQCFTSELFTLRTGQRAPAEVLNSHAGSASSWHIHAQQEVVQLAHMHNQKYNQQFNLDRAMYIQMDAWMLSSSEKQISRTEFQDRNLTHGTNIL